MSDDEVRIYSFAQISRESAKEIISESALTLLPFDAAPISAWRDDCDLLEFLTRISDHDTTAWGPSGRERVVNYAHYGRTLFEDGQREFVSLAEEFQQNAANAHSAPAALPRVESPPHFIDDPSFGLLAKSKIAWSGAMNVLLSENAFQSLAHVLESDDDLECAIALACRMYYRQGLQVLRNFLEDSLMQSHFANDPSAFPAWRRGALHTPRMRGRNGLIEQLVERQLLSLDLADHAGRLYGALSGSVHGSEDALTNRGADTEAWSGRIFQADRYQQFCDYAASCVEYAFSAYRLTLLRWL